MANTATRRGGQCQKPSGLLGRFVLWQMNARHSKVTDWGLRHTAIQDHEIILDIGCGGGRTVFKLAAVATRGKVYGIDYSSQSVAVATKINREWIKMGRVEIQEASVSRLPFPDNTFDLVTAVETHFWWPDLPSDIREVLRVIKPGGRLVIVAEVYKGASSLISKLAEKASAVSGMALLSADEHKELLAAAGYTDVQIATDSGKGWICAIGKKR
jgi:ubiquinone/menaquinone biosynthesis C-methylase UbiE